MPVVLDDDPLLWNLCNPSVVVATVIPLVLLHVLEPLFVYFSHLLQPCFPVFVLYVLVSLLPHGAYDDLLFSICEALCWNTLQTGIATANALQTGFATAQFHMKGSNSTTMHCSSR
jgi:hypothetical protein